ncbi:DNA (cytosine-5-)-methyltransferase [Paenibacillus apiarius]|uniref:DNA (cytosine-5-)-methyltransferase n=1 Tax=Paenibacillus apiarius TaxID=46240 RepID=UPI003B3BCE73
MWGWRKKKRKWYPINFNYIELFAGIGGFRSALDILGGRCVFASEIDRFAQNSYCALYGSVPEICGDITQIDAVDIPAHDILVAGFPCQAFSIAGYRKGFDDTRGTLFFEVARVLQEKQPNAFILENVKGLVGHDSGRTFRRMLDVLESLGYKVQHTVLNSSIHGGLPHHRERVFIVGTRRPIQFSILPEPVPLSVSLPELLQVDVDEKYYLSAQATERLRRIEERAALRGLGYKSVEVTVRRVNRRLREKRPQLFLNLDANFFKGPDGKRTMIRVVEADGRSRLRMPTPLECWRLQGFTDEQFKKARAAGISDSQLYKQAGNAVTVNVISAISRRLIPVLLAESVRGNGQASDIRRVEAVV